MAKLTDFIVSADRQTDIEMYQGYGSKTVIIEWDDETRMIHGFDEADHVYTGNSLDKCGEALGLDADQMAGLVGSDVVYVERSECVSQNPYSDAWYSRGEAGFGG